MASTFVAPTLGDGEGDRPAPTVAVEPAAGRSRGPVELPVDTRLGDGRYRVGPVLGQGGFGITYAAIDERLRRRVAIKELFPDGARRDGLSVVVGAAAAPAFARSRHRFLREATTLARFVHPGIVRIWATLEEHGTAYLVLERLDGRTLAEELRVRRGPFTEAEALDVAAQTSAALAMVHRAGVLHRDVSPANLVRTAEGRIVLIDFGLAQPFLLDHTVAMTRIVTPGYAPPEQHAGAGRFAPRSDVYALGATLYRLVTGRIPPAAVDRAAGAGVVPAWRVNPTVSRPVSAALDAALALDPEARPATVEGLMGLLGLDRTDEDSAALDRAAADRAGWAPAAGPDGARVVGDLGPAPDGLGADGSGPAGLDGGGPGRRDPGAGTHPVGSVAGPASADIGPTVVEPVDGAGPAVDPVAATAVVPSVPVEISPAIPTDAPVAEGVGGAVVGPGGRGEETPGGEPGAVEVTVVEIGAPVEGLTVDGPGSGASEDETDAPDEVPWRPAVLDLRDEAHPTVVLAPTNGAPPRDELGLGPVSVPAPPPVRPVVAPGGAGPVIARAPGAPSTVVPPPVLPAAPVDAATARAPVVPPTSPAAAAAPAVPRPVVVPAPAVGPAPVPAGSPVARPRAPHPVLASGTVPRGRSWLTLPLGLAAVALASAQPVTMTVLLGVGVAPVLATAGDRLLRPHRRLGWLPLWWARNLASGLVRSLGAGVILLVGLCLWYGTEAFGSLDAAGPWVLRATGVGAGWLLASSIGRGGPGFRSHVALDHLALRLLPRGRLTVAAAVVVLVSLGVAAAGAWFTPEAWPLGG